MNMFMYEIDNGLCMSMNRCWEKAVDFSRLFDNACLMKYD